MARKRVWRMNIGPNDHIHFVDGMLRLKPANYILVSADENQQLGTWVENLPAGELDELSRRIAVDANVVLAAIEEEIAPPVGFWLDLLTKPQTAKDWRANVEDVYPEWVQRHGVRKARWMWHFQTWRVIIGEWLMPIMSLIDRLKGLVFK